MSVIIYLFFYIGTLVLGFFGIAPLMIAPSFDERFPYIVLIVFGYPTLIGALIYTHRRGYTGRTLLGKEKGVEPEKHPGGTEEVEISREVPEDQKGTYIPE